MHIKQLIVHVLCGMLFLWDELVLLTLFADFTIFLVLFNLALLTPLYILV